MAAKVKLNTTNLGRAIKSSETQRVLNAEAERLARIAGDGNVAVTGSGRAAVVSYKGKHSLAGLKRAAGR